MRALSRVADLCIFASRQNPDFNASQRILKADRFAHPGFLDSNLSSGF
jgi:hypothetical protein